MTVEKRKTGYKVRDHRKGRSRTFPRLRDAKLRDAEWFLEQEANVPVMRDLFIPWLDWLVDNRSKAHSTQMFRFAMKEFADIHDTPYFDVNPEYVERKVLKKRSVKFRKRLLNALNGCFKWNLGQTRRVIEYNPIDQWKIWEPEEEAKRPYVPPDEDIEKLILYLERKQDDKLLVIRMAIELGVRIGEIVNTGVKPDDKWLRWMDVYLTDKPWVRIYTRKTGRSSWREDHLPISSDLSARLTEWKLKTGGRDHVFPWNYSGLYDWLQRSCKAVRIQPFGWHSFRHFYAHYLDRQGVAHERIQGGLRHTSVKQTSGYLRGMEVDRSILEHTFKTKPSPEPIDGVKEGVS